MPYAFKHVPMDFARAFEEGESIRLGTFGAYSRMEGMRSDRSEGSQRNYLTKEISETDTDARMALDQLYAIQFSQNVENLQINNVFVSNSYEKKLIFCMSTQPDFDLCDREKLAVFRIEVRPFLEEIVKAHHYLGDCVANRVVYDKRDGDISKGEARSFNPFQKPQKFEWEKEYRVVFSSDSGENFVNLRVPQAANSIRRTFRTPEELRAAGFEPTD